MYAKRITPTENASRRTKNRIKEKGPCFYISREAPVICFGNEFVTARLVSSPDGWVGWLPIDEIVCSK